MMAKQKINPKKEMQAFVLETLGKTLDKVKEGMTEKKFMRNIKKASKLIVEDFKLPKEKKVSEKKQQPVNA